MDSKQFEIINAKIDTLISLHAYTLVNGKKVHEQVQILSSVGLKTKHIAKMLGKTENNIKQVLHQIRTKTNSTSE